jgi:hypothetical protein
MRAISLATQMEESIKECFVAGGFGKDGAILGLKCFGLRHKYLLSIN